MITLFVVFVVIALLIDSGAADDALTSKEADVGLSTGIKNTNTHIIEESSDVDDNFCSIVKLQCDPPKLFVNVLHYHFYQLLHYQSNDDNNQHLYHWQRCSLSLYYI